MGGYFYQESASCAVLISRCLTLGDRIGDAAPVSLFAELRGLINQIPDSLTLGDQILARTAIARGLADVLRRRHVEAWPELTNVLLELATGNSTATAFRLECLRVLERCSKVLGVREQRLNGHDSLHRVLRVIHARHREERVTLQKVAQEAKLSSWHVSRLLNQHFGCSFTTYLNRLRISAAQHLLLDTTLSIKQVAAAVGYGNTSQFDRHFKRICHTTPVAFRNGVLGRAVAPEPGPSAEPTTDLDRPESESI